MNQIISAHRKISFLGSRAEQWLYLSLGLLNHSLTSGLNISPKEKTWLFLLSLDVIGVSYWHSICNFYNKCNVGITLGQCISRKAHSESPSGPTFSSLTTTYSQWFFFILKTHTPPPVTWFYLSKSLEKSNVLSVAMLSSSLNDSGSFTDCVSSLQRNRYIERSWKAVFPSLRWSENLSLLKWEVYRQVKIAYWACQR